MIKYFFEPFALYYIVYKKLNNESITYQYNKYGLLSIKEMTSVENPNSSSTVPLPRIQVVEWNPHAYWKFKSAEPECQICKNHFEEPCLECSTDHNKGEMKCDVSRGKCGHCFHTHCIDKWRQKTTICPICKTPYNTDVKDMDNNVDWKRLISGTGKK